MTGVTRRAARLYASLPPTLFAHRPFAVEGRRTIIYPTPTFAERRAHVWFDHARQLFRVAFREKTWDGLVAGREDAWFVLAHELGHVVLHAPVLQGLEPRRSSIEMEADAFAAQFLGAARRHRDERATEAKGWTIYGTMVGLWREMPRAPQE